MLSISMVKYTPRVPLILLTVQKIECENFNLVLSFYFLSFPHAWLKNMPHLQTTCTPNGCFTTRDFFLWLELYASWDWQVMDWNIHSRLFFVPFCVYFTQKFQTKCAQSKKMTTPPSYIVFSGFEPYPWYDRWIMDRNMHCSLFPVRHLCVLRLITWQLHVMHERCTYRMTALLLEISVVLLYIKIY